MSGFKRELKALLEKYDAEIYFECGDPDFASVYDSCIAVETSVGSPLLSVPGFSLGAKDIAVDGCACSVSVLVDALKFYANRDNWVPVDLSVNSPADAIDYGVVARAALDKVAS